MVYYNDRYDMLAIKISTSNLLEINDSGIGVMVLTPEWTVVATV